MLVRRQLLVNDRRARLERGQRDGAAAQAALRRVAEAARGSENLMDPILEAVKAYATLGEIAQAMRDVFGEHKEAVKF